MSQDFDKKADIPMPDWVKNGLGIAQFNGPPDIASVPVSTGVRLAARPAPARASEPQYVDLVEAMDDWGCAHDHPEIMREVAELMISNAERDGRKIGEVRLARASSGEGLREALISIRDMPEYDQDDAHRLREKARAALKSEGKE